MLPLVAPSQAAQATFMQDLWRDTVGFMGAVMVRRIVGIAHVAEMKTIADPDTRWGPGCGCCWCHARCRGRGLRGLHALGQAVLLPT